ncbi:maleylpyruvate isomerase family mycothiol-dependent enzyme [Pengzhenrongella sicca]|uniref:Maleylpyruvate isomerase family mycothiol-dependent enzyme n=1 Tax=Pengzhenrongella sicca TaxID=2819238 RepID=A0A8A4Z9K4_9MICO|nr:maleylpyruvate isomerase family mycothiol-dependent enzyme [Pengzhenrongella sicca]QTE28155.1 maleylpyruvate isomerase family mycothiol-dependent enzyme [Pengzhenrongella sicca]
MPTHQLDHLAELVDVQEAFGSSIGEVDPRAPVPSCGTWEVHDLVVHLATIHHWAAAQGRGVDDAPLGPGPFVLGDLYRACARELRDTLSELGPDAIGATLLGPGPASFWRRRQLHEALVHLWDLRTAGGLGLAVRPPVWADTVDEVVTVLHPRQVRLGRMPRLRAPIELAATDVDRMWRLDSAAGGPAVARLRAPASVLALTLWGRSSPDDPRLEVSGDRTALRAALAGPLTP